MKNNDIIKLEKYLRRNPDDHNARLNLAYLFVNSNLLNAAIKQYQTILNKKEDLKTMFNLAICFSNLNKFKESELLLNRIIKKDSNHFNALRALGDIYFKQNQIEKSYKTLNLAKKINEEDPILLNILGVIEMKKSKYRNAEINFLKSIKNNKDYISAQNNLALLYQKIGKIDNSYEILKNLLIKLPMDKNILNNFGSVLIDLDQYDKGIKYLNKAIKIDSTQSAYFSNLGRAFFFKGQHAKARTMLDKALILYPNNDEAKIILFYLSIIKKDLKKAWKYFSARINTKHYFTPNNLHIPNKIQNKKILILREAGLGDEVLYSSMYAELIKNNNRVTIECDPRLKNIFKHSFNYSNFISTSSSLRNKSNLKNFDMTVYAGTLCSIFRNKLSNFNYNKFLIPNLKLTQKYKKTLDEINNLPKIGISWISSRLDLGKDKSIKLQDLFPILKNKKLSFVNLQYGDHKKSINDFNIKNKLNIIDFPKIDKFNDIDKLLALIESLDLVITVSNTTAHLAGAIGKKTMLLAPTNRAQLFYWMLLKKKTPWYPSIQIFKKNKDWKRALIEVEVALNKIF